VDVLVLLGRILRIPDRPVRAVPEPLRVLRDPGMVWAALQRVVERDLEPGGLGGGDELVEVVDGAEARVDGGVTTGGRTDRPWAPGIPRRALDRVVRPLPM